MFNLFASLGQVISAFLQFLGKPLYTFGKVIFSVKSALRRELAVH